MSKRRRKANEEERFARFPNLARVRQLAFLFRRDIANVLRGENGTLWAGSIFSAIGGGPNCQSGIDTLTSKFHPDSNQRRDAARRILDDLEFGLESEARKAEFAGDAEVAKMIRRQARELRTTLEQRVGHQIGNT
jgi:hypothetical protein